MCFNRKMKFTSCSPVVFWFIHTRRYLVPVQFDMCKDQVQFSKQNFPITTIVKIRNKRKIQKNDRIDDHYRAVWTRRLVHWKSTMKPVTRTGYAKLNDYLPDVQSSWYCFLHGARWTRVSGIRLWIKPVESFDFLDNCIPFITWTV